jgi:hypothetical protein
MHEQRALEPRLRLELGEQPVDVVDVPGALDLRHHDHLELVADLADELREVVEHPGDSSELTRVQRAVSPRSISRPDPDQPLAGRLLAVDRDRVLEVAEQDVHLRRQVGRLGHHLLVREVEEVDHPRRREGDLREGLGSAHGQRLEEVSGVAHGLQPSAEPPPDVAHPAERGLRGDTVARPLTDESTNQPEGPNDETKQADREASGARPYGRYLEDFDAGAVYKHWPAKTVTEADDHMFCLSR